jgi:hypothetical protein
LMQGFLVTGGAGGIRTRGGFDPSHAFQACDLNRSSTAPASSSLTEHGDDFWPIDN